MAIVDPFATPTAPVGIVDPFAPSAAAQLPAAAPDAAGTMEGFAPPSGAVGAIPPAEGAARGGPPSRVPGIVAGALAPYATAAGAGALMGAPVGGIGAIPGAVAGVGALALSDLAALGYNVAAPAFGGRPIQMPSEAIESLYRRGGVGVAPETLTPEEAVLASGVRGGASALGGVGAARTFAQQAASPTVRRVANWFASQPVTQTAAGVGAGVAPAVAREYYDVQDPLALGLISVAGGVGAAKTAPMAGRVLEGSADFAQRLATGVRSSREALSQNIDDLFSSARQSGATYTPQSFDRLIDEVRDIGSKIDPRATELSAPIRAVLNTVENFKGTPNTVEQLHALRKNVGKIAYDRETTPEVRGILLDIRNSLDNYISTPSNVTVASGDPAAGMQLIQGIRNYARQMKSDEILDIVERASMNTSVPISSSIRTQFKQLADPKHPKRLAGFTEDEKEVIRAIAKGKAEWSPLKFLTSLSPTNAAATRAALPLAGGGATYYGTGDPYAAGAVTLGMYGAGRGAQSLQNQLAMNAANRLAAGIRRGDVVAPTSVPAGAAAVRVAPQALMNAMSPYGDLNLNAFSQ